jgi:hypothetical protein
MNMNLSLIDHKGLLKKLQMRPLFSGHNVVSKINTSGSKKKTLGTIDRSDTSFSRSKKLVRDDLLHMRIINKLKKKNELGGLMFKNPDFRKCNKTFINKNADISALYRIKQRGQSYNFEDSANSKILSTISKDNSVVLHNRTVIHKPLPINKLSFDEVRLTDQPVKLVSKDDFTFRDLSVVSHINTSSVVNTTTAASKAIFEMKKAENPIRLKQNSLINTIKVKIRSENDMKTKQSFYKLIKLDPSPKVSAKYTFSHKNTVSSGAMEDLNMSFNVESRSTAVNESIRKSRDSPKLMIRHPHIRDFFEK